MARTEPTTVVGVFERPGQAEEAVGQLRRLGFRDDQIGLAYRDEAAAGRADAARMADEGGPAPEEGGTRAEEGAAAGAAVGGVLGAAAALLLPGLGALLAAGTLAAVLGGAAAGAAAGGLVGALVGMGVPEEEAAYSAGEVRAGRSIVTVRAEGRAPSAREALRAAGAADVETRGGPRGPGTAPSS